MITTLTYLLEELLLYCDVMVGYAQHYHSILRSLALLLSIINRSLLLLASTSSSQYIDFVDQLVLNKNEGFHRVLKSQLMLSHLTQDSADVKMDVTRVAHLETVFDSLITEVQVVVFNLQCLLQVVESTSELLSATEDASEVVVGHCSESVCLFCECLCLSKQLQSHVEVIYVKLKLLKRSYPSARMTSKECCR